MGFLFFPIWVWGSAWRPFGPPELHYNVSSIITPISKIFVIKVVILQLESVGHQQRHNPFILIPRAHDPSGLRQGSRALGWSNTGSLRFTDFPSNLANLIGWEYETNTLCVLRKSGPARALDPCRRPERSWALGTRMRSIGINDVHLFNTELAMHYRTILKYGCFPLFCEQKETLLLCFGPYFSC